MLNSNTRGQVMSKTWLMKLKLAQYWENLVSTGFLLPNFPNIELILASTLIVYYRF